VDASALDAVGISATGIVAVVGTSKGGKPYSAVSSSDVKGTLQASTSPGKAKGFFQKGSQMIEAESFLFNPSADEDIEGGAQKVFWVKPNKSTASTLAMANGDGQAIVYTSEDYGYHTQQISIAQGAGTSKGKLITITGPYQGVQTTEAFDNVGGDVLFTWKYLATAPAGGFTTITATASATALLAAFTRDSASLTGEIDAQITAGNAIELSSADAGDTQVVRVYGMDNAATPAAQTEEITLNGTTAVLGTAVWSKIHGISIPTAPAGTVTAKNGAGGATVATLTPAALTKGLSVCSDCPVGKGTLSVKASGASTDKVGVYGLSASGTLQYEVITLAGTTPVAGTSTWSRIDYVAMGAVATVTVTVSGTAAAVYFSGYDTIQKAADYINGLGGMTFTVVTGKTGYLLTNLDRISTGVSIKTTAYSFYGDLWAIIEKINAESGLVTAARGSVGSGVPTNAAAQYMAGGNEGSSTPGQEGTPTATAADWQASLDLLKKVFVNTVVVLTPDAAVHAQLKAHCAYMGGAGQMERDGIVGVMNAAKTGMATKTEIKSQIVAINSRHLRVVAQRVQRYNAAGSKETFEPYMAALLAAGMQAGSEVGTSLTNKLMSTLKIEQDSSWNPADDAEEMLEAGLLFGEVVDGQGIRWVRNVTSCVSSNNLRDTDANVNEAVNVFVYNFRSEMERAVGARGFASTVAATDGVAREKLRVLTGVAIVTWRSLNITLTLDVLAIDVEVAPVISINFVRNTIHLVSAPISNVAS